MMQTETTPKVKRPRKIPKNDLARQLLTPKEKKRKMWQTFDHYQFDAAKEMVEIAMQAKADGDRQLQFLATKEILDRQHPKLRAIEISSDKEAPVLINFNLPDVAPMLTVQQDFV